VLCSLSQLSAEASVGWKQNVRHLSRPVQNAHRHQVPVIEYALYAAVFVLCSVSVGVPRIIQWREFTWWGPGQGAWGTMFLGTKSPEKLKQNVKVYNV